MYKMVEKLDRMPVGLKIVLTCKDDPPFWGECADATLTLQGLNNPVTVLAGVGAFPRWVGKARPYLREIRQCWRLYKIYLRFRPDLLYMDRANLWCAGLFARLLSKPVVFRVMGVKHDMVEAQKGRKPMHAAMRWAYRAPYAAVVCTQDGSDVEAWVESALDPKVPRKILLNGVDADDPGQEGADERIAALPKDRTIVLFVGKLEKIKGCEEFMRAFLMAYKEAGEGLHALVIGAGSRETVLREMVAGQNAQEAVTFIAHLGHDQVMKAHSRADIYVSLNRLGNLSNANLEAMKAGSCMILSVPQTKHGMDSVTEGMIHAGAALRLPPEGEVEALGRTLLQLHRNPLERKKLVEEMARESRRFIQEWENRLITEVELLRRIAGRDGGAGTEGGAVEPKSQSSVS